VFDKVKDVDKSDDPIRMYLREMGGVELLSREGEIAIAKRIEAGKSFMINGLFQSPLTAQKVFEWKEKLEEDELLVREIIDIDSSYMESEDENSTSKKNKHIENKQTNDKSEKLKKNLIPGENNNETGDVKNQEYLEEDEFNPSLAAMEEEIKPQIISTINFLCKDYTKLIYCRNYLRFNFFFHCC
jgi:RNA polymerase primary sigma factor